jgi:hypothetical protein
MKNKLFIITVDTEANWFEANTGNVSNINGVHFLQEKALKYNYLPTYLVTHDIATKEESIRALIEYSNKNLCEIGHHLHVCCTPPFISPNKYNIDDKMLLGIQSELSNEVFEKKMQSLHDAIVTNFQITPTSHRAGRWAIDMRTLLWLEKNNYLVDSSVCPYKSWNYYTKGHKDYIKTNTFTAPNYPYYPDKKDLTKEALESESQLNILEVPATGIHLDYFSGYGQKAIIFFTLLMNKLGSYKFGNISFRPSYNIEIGQYEKMVRKLFESDIPIYNFMFHSNELALGTSPYSKSPSLLKDLLIRIELVFKLANEYGIKGLKLSDTAKHFTSPKIQS